MLEWIMVLKFIEVVLVLVDYGLNREKEIYKE